MGLERLEQRFSIIYIRRNAVYVLYPYTHIPLLPHNVFIIITCSSVPIGYIYKKVKGLTWNIAWNTLEQRNKRRLEALCGVDFYPRH